MVEGRSCTVLQAVCHDVFSCGLLFRILQIRKSDFRHVHAPNAGSLATCDDCDLLKLAKNDAFMMNDVQGQTTAHQLLEAHREVFSRERVAMMANMERAKKRPEELAMLFVD